MGQKHTNLIRYFFTINQSVFFENRMDMNKDDIDWK
jgi:hypothetical protein